MKHRIVTGLFGVTLALTAVASVRQSPYDVIVARNPFGLRPVPVVVPPPPETPLPPPLPEIKLTGMTTLLGRALVTLQYEDKETKKTEFPPLLTEGESYKKLMVERIDTENQTVVVRNGDTLMTLDFIKNGLKTAAATGPALASVPAGNPPPFPAPPRTSAPTASDSRVLIAGGGTTPSQPQPRTAMTPDQARAYMEEWRRKQQEQTGASSGSQPGSVIVPPHSLAR
jgi:hypothetical protein